MLTRCSACNLPCDSVVSNLPCEECLSSLLASPGICAVCLGFTCQIGVCERPWLRVEGADSELRFDSVTAAYLSIGPGAHVLKSWKKAPSPSLTRFLRQSVKEKIARFDRPLLIVPVPQSGARRWVLNGGSALRLCEIILEIRREPRDRLVDLLELSVDRDLEPQALKKGGQRYSRRSAIQPKEIPHSAQWAPHVGPTETGADILLVDDFLTSGSTLRSATGAVRRQLNDLDRGCFRRRRVDVFVLGFRPALFGSDGQIRQTRDIQTDLRR